MPHFVGAQDVQGFVHPSSEAAGYVVPADADVRARLTDWQDLKFGALVHWGLYSVPGIVESWSICSEDVDWIRRRDDLSYDAYKDWYFSLKDSLNPTRFDPDGWARAAADAGMKYLIFTTKHHDGFCLFDTQETDFKITAGPFRSDGRDPAREVFDACRRNGLWVGAYFSKPDWHCPWFWNPHFATPNRQNNYRRDRHPEWWQNYRSFTQRQLRELLTRYGRIDILWLDGGWVSGDEVGLDTLLAEARAGAQPGLISVDRSIRGKNENYFTPERGVPSEPLGVPWESCIPLSNDWGWVPNAPYKSARRVVGTLIEVVAKGGCLVLGLGPCADGTLEEGVLSRLRDIGDWLRRNGEAIYATRPLAQFQSGDVWFTQSKDGRTAFALYALPDGERLPAQLSWKAPVPAGKITLLNTGKRLSFKTVGDSVVVSLPANLPQEPLALKFAPAPRK